MAVFRVEKNHSYTVMANHHLRDERLSLKSKGLLSLILSLPDDWRISIEGMTQFSSDGKDAIRSAIRELTDAGYITRAQTHSEAGTFSGYDYLVHETPVASPSSGFPTMEKPTTGNPTTENPTQRNTDILSTNIPPIVPHEVDVGDYNPSVSGAAADSPTPLSAACGGISPRRGESALYTREPLGGGNPSVSLAADTSPDRGGKEGEKGEAAEDDPLRQPAAATSPGGRGKRRGTAKKAPDYRPDTFARFWAAYPRGEDKQGAIAAWDELKPDDATLQAMSRALVRQKASEEWQRGIGIPYAVRWLRRRRWEDEIKAPAPPPERAGGDLPVWN